MLCDNPAYVDDLRFALEVMDEYSHLGLDSEHASKLCSLVLDKIERAEEALQRDSEELSSIGVDR